MVLKFVYDLCFSLSYHCYNHCISSIFLFSRFRYIAGLQISTDTFNHSGLLTSTMFFCSVTSIIHASLWDPDFYNLMHFFIKDSRLSNEEPHVLSIPRQTVIYFIFNHKLHWQNEMVRPNNQPEGNKIAFLWSKIIRWLVTTWKIVSVENLIKQLQLTSLLQMNGFSLNWECLQDLVPWHGALVHQVYS